MQNKQMRDAKAQSKRMVLASASPRRKELLELMGLEFCIIPSKKEEVITKTEPSEIVKELAAQKAEDILNTISEDVLVIGSDTIVVCDGEVMGKPADEESAFAMLHKLQGRTHQVYTGVAVMQKENNKITSDIFAEKAEVTVCSMADEEIWWYIRRGESMDKAGAYGVQGSFGVFVKEIKGEYNTVLGLPIASLYQVLKKYC